MDANFAVGGCRANKDVNVVECANTVVPHHCFEEVAKDVAKVSLAVCEGEMAEEVAEWGSVS